MKQIVFLTSILLSIVTSTLLTLASASTTLDEIKAVTANASKYPFDYVWEKPSGANRIQRGISTTSKLNELSSRSLNPILTCHADETLVNGGCSAVYGFKLQGGMPLAQTSDPGVEKWICNFDVDLASALTVDGDKQPPQTFLPADQLTGTTYIVVTCEKTARKPCKGLTCN